MEDAKNTIINYVTVVCIHMFVRTLKYLLKGIIWITAAWGSLQIQFLMRFELKVSDVIRSIDGCVNGDILVRIYTQGINNICGGRISKRDQHITIHQINWYTTNTGNVT